MIRLTFIVVFFLFSAFSCSKYEETVDPVEGIPAPIIKVVAPATAAVGETIPIEVYFVVNNGCGYFGRFETDGSGTEQTIKVYAKYSEGFCTMALVTLKENYNFKQTTKGTYTLNFYYEPDKFITRTIVVGDVNASGQ